VLEAPTPTTSAAGKPLVIRTLVFTYKTDTDTTHIAGVVAWLVKDGKPLPDVSGVSLADGKISFKRLDPDGKYSVWIEKVPQGYESDSILDLTKTEQEVSLSSLADDVKAGIPAAATKEDVTNAVSGAQQAIQGELSNVGKTGWPTWIILVLVLIVIVGVVKLIFF
jgi:hypothetical protein